MECHESCLLACNLEDKYTHELIELIHTHRLQHFFSFIPNYETEFGFDWAKQFVRRLLTVGDNGVNIAQLAALVCECNEYGDLGIYHSWENTVNDTCQELADILIDITKQSAFIFNLTDQDIDWQEIGEVLEFYGKYRRYI